MATTTKAENAGYDSSAGIFAYGVAAVIAVVVCLGFGSLFANFYTGITSDPDAGNVVLNPQSKVLGHVLSLPFGAIAAWQVIFALKKKFSPSAGPVWMRMAADNIVVRIVIFLSLLFGLSTHSQLIECVGAVIEGSFGLWAGAADALIDAMATLVAFFLVAMLFHRKPLTNWGLRLDKKMPLDVLVGFVGGGMMMSLIAGGLAFTNVYHFTAVNWGAQILPALVFFSLAALIEELIFRGYIFQSVEAKYGTSLALLVTAVLFGFAHMMNVIPGASMWMKIYGCACLVLEAGILLNAAFIFRRTLWFATGVHWAWNAFEGPVFGMDVSGTDGGPSVFTGKLVGDAFVTGGQFGPEASLCGMLVGTAFGALLIWMCIRRKQWLTGDQARKIESERLAALAKPFGTVDNNPQSAPNPNVNPNTNPSKGIGYDI